MKKLSESRYQFVHSLSRKTLSRPAILLPVQKQNCRPTYPHTGQLVRKAKENGQSNLLYSETFTKVQHFLFVVSGLLSLCFKLNGSFNSCNLNFPELDEVEWHQSVGSLTTDQSRWSANLNHSQCIVCTSWSVVKLLRNMFLPDLRDAQTTQKFTWQLLTGQ